METFLKIIVATAASIAGLVAFRYSWSAHWFFVPKRDKWTKSGSEQLGAKFFFALTCGTVVGMVFYLSAMERLGKSGSLKGDPNPVTVSPSDGSSPADNNMPDALFPPRNSRIERAEDKLLHKQSPSLPETVEPTRSGSQNAANPRANIAERLPLVLPGHPDNTRQKSAETAETDLESPLSQKSLSGEISNYPTVKPDTPWTSEASGVNPKSHGTIPMKGERYPETRLRILDQNYARGLGDAQLRYAINEMFARHGAIFPQREINGVFEDKTWYHPDRSVGFDDIERIRFSATERANIQTLGAERDFRKNGAATVKEPSIPVTRMRFIDSLGNLRSGPGTQFVIIRNPKQGESGAFENRSGDWILLRFDTGETGWTHTRNLEPAK